MAKESKFFVAGGTLRPNVRSYVKRPSDDELFSLAQDGEFCYVLTPRQMGKSSLMVRTANRLQEEGVRTVIIDLTEIGIVSIDEWYLGLITEIQRALRLPVDVSQWWSEKQHLGQPQRFRDFLQDVVLGEVEGQIVIFIDEIDSTLNLTFRDDFFAVIRAFYNGRSRHPELARLSFVLLGVASPSDLIEDRTRTPFNIGHEINLKEISYDDAFLLIEQLNHIFPNRGAAIFKRIYYWTSGHPYLTQKLCASITQSPEDAWQDPAVDALVARTFITDEARGETNIQFVNDLITTHPKKVEMIKIYRRVYKGQEVEEEKTSPAQSALKLSGLVKVEDSDLVVRNQIYRDAFDLDWVKEHTAVNWQLLVTIASLTIAFIAVSFLGFNFYQSQKADNAELAFRQGQSPQARAEALTTLFGMQPMPLIGNSNDLRAYDLFFELDSWEEQAGIYEIAEEDRLILIVQKMYVTMALVDVDNDDSSHALEKMFSELEEFQSDPEAQKLRQEIESWLLAREEMENGRFDEALASYNAALDLNDQNPATRFERARVLAVMARYEDTAVDLDSVMALAGQSAIPEATATPQLEASTSEATLTKSPELTTTPTAFATQTAVLTKTESTATLTPTANPNETKVTMPEDTILATTPEVTPIITEQPTAIAIATPKPIFRSQFVTRGQIRSAVNKLIDEYPDLGDYLGNVVQILYQNLAEFGLIPTTTPTPTVPTTEIVTVTLSVTPIEIATTSGVFLTPTSVPFIEGGTISETTLSPTETVTESENVLPQTAQEAHAQLIEKGEIVIGVPINGGVLSQPNEQGVYEGFEVDIAREFAKRWFGSEQNITIIPVTSPERIPFLEDGTVDLIVAALTRTDDRCTNYVECSQTYFKDGARLLVRRDSGITGLCNLDGEFVAAVTGTTGADSVIANASFFCDENVQIDVLAQYVDRSSAINAVRNQEASAYVTDGVILTSFEDDQLIVVGDELSDEPYAVGARKGNVGLIQLVELTLQEMTQDGTYREIYEKWFRCSRAPFSIDLTYDEAEVPAFVKDIDDPASETLCAAISTYTVQPGDNFFGIALEVFGDAALYPCIQEFNGIEDVSELSVGQVLGIPSVEACTVAPPGS